MYAHLDCNLRQVVTTGSVTDNLTSHSAQQKNLSKYLVPIQHFPLLEQSPGAMPCVAQHKKCPMMFTDKTFLVCCLFIASCSAIFLSCSFGKKKCEFDFPWTRIYSSTKCLWVFRKALYKFWVLVLTLQEQSDTLPLAVTSLLCVLLFFRRNLTTSSWHRAQNKNYLHCPSPPLTHRCETQMFLGR